MNNDNQIELQMWEAPEFKEILTSMECTCYASTLSSEESKEERKV